MRLTSLRIKNFLTFGETSGDLSDLGATVLLVGPNGSGKTTIFRAIEFVSAALARSAPAAAPFVHGQDLARGIELDLGVQLTVAEQRIIVTAALVAFGKELRSTQGEARFDHPEAKSVVRRVIGACRPLFEPLFSGEVHFCVTTSPGHGQDVERFVRVSSPGGDLCFDKDGHLARAPFRSSSWSIVSLPEEIFNRIRAALPEAFERAKKKVEFSQEMIRTVADSIGPDWLFASVAPRDGTPTSIDSEPIQRAQLSQRNSGLALDDTIALEEFLRASGEQFPNLSIFDVLARLYSSSIQGVTEERSKVASLGAGHPWAPWEPGTGPLSFDLPKTLFDWKNSPDLSALRRFSQLGMEFEKLSGVCFDVVWETRQIPTSDAQTPPRTAGLPVLSFHEGNLVYPGTLAAAGYCELLLVLTGVAGPSHSVVLLDEPALNLHPVKQRELLQAISRLASEGANQLLIVTHSPDFVEINTLPNGFRLSMVDGETRVRSLRVPAERMAGKIGKLVEVDPTVAGALFARRVVLVEGHDEAAALPIWLGKCSPAVDLGAQGVLFINVEGKGSFPWYAGAMEAWGVPYRLVGDCDSSEILLRLGGKGFAYMGHDFTDILQTFCKQEFDDAMETWGGGPKNPLVAREVALACPPPPPIQKVWEFLHPFISGAVDPLKARPTPSDVAEGSTPPRP